MNLIHIQDQLKGLPTQAIMAYANGQNPEVPPYVALAELNRRKQMQSGAGAMQGGQAPTIKDQIEQSTGLMGLQNAQQQQSMQQMAQAPQQGPVPQSAPQGPVQGAPQEGFAGGGAVAFDEGGDVSSEDIYDPATGALISSGGQWQEPTVEEEWKKKYLKKPAVSDTRALSAKEEGIVAALAARQQPPRQAPPEAAAKPAMPAPQQVAKGIAQGAPKQEAPQDLAATMQSAAAKMQPELIQAIQDGLKKGMTIDEAVAEAKRFMPVSKYQEMLANELATSRKAELARRDAPKNWYENEGLMATLRGFAQADPRRPWGAAGAASADFNEKQRTARAAEDAAYRQGLAGLGKSEEERNTKSLDYGLSRSNADKSARNNAITAGTQMTDAAMRQAQADKNHQAQMAQIREQANDRAQRASDAALARGDALAASKVQTLLKQDETGLAKIETEYPMMLRGSPKIKAQYDAALSAHRSRMANAAKALNVPGYEAPAPGEVPLGLKSGIATQTTSGNKNPALAAALAQYGPKKQ